MVAKNGKSFSAFTVTRMDLKEALSLRARKEWTMSLASISEELRGSVLTPIPRKERSSAGQFMTPPRIARFMAGMFQKRYADCRLLDPGAGLGSLTSAFLDRCAVDPQFHFEHIQATAVESDPRLSKHLIETFACGPSNLSISHEVIQADFLATANDWAEEHVSFSHALINPPYKKLSASSAGRLSLRELGIESVNLYAAFVSLSLRLLELGGQLVAIIPRSFCNGPYYKAFRQEIMDSCAIMRIHLFHARDKVFEEDSVLQENIILVLEKGGLQRDVLITSSSDGELNDLESNAFPFHEIVLPSDRDSFIRIPLSQDNERPTSGFPLGEIGLEVSTGPVVEFRLREYSTSMPSEDSVPLLYPSHFREGRLEWPLENFRKPNALSLNDETWRWLYPIGFYVVVRRFSSKEESRRIVATVLSPNDLPGYSHLGFENSLNVFHLKKRGLDEALARGLALHLNSPEVDAEFRAFNGHTQVNATDLRKLLYPTLADLRVMASSRSIPGVSNGEVMGV